MYDPAQPYPSQRSPVAADNLVATSQPLAIKAAVNVLRNSSRPAHPPATEQRAS